MRVALTQDFDNERRVMNIIQLTKALGLASAVHQSTLTTEDTSVSEIIQNIMQNGPDDYMGYWWNIYATDDFKESAKIFAKALLADGFKCIGRGHFSLAMTHPDTPNVVYKMSFRADDAYSHYALWCRMNPYQHAPTMLRIERHGDWHIYAMPKYERPDNKWELYSAISKWAENDEMIAEDTDRALVPRSLRMFIIKMRDYFHNVCPLDLHDENFMIDPSSGDIIITDPVSFNTKRNPEHELALRNKLQETYLDQLAA